MQGFSQGFETGCPKLAIVKFWCVLFIKGDQNILRWLPKACIYLIEIRHNILIQCRGIYIGVKKFNYMLKIDISKNYHQKLLGVLRGDFEG